VRLEIQFQRRVDACRLSKFSKIVVAYFLESTKTPTPKRNLCRVYTCRFDNQVANERLIKKYFVVVKLAQYFVCKVDRKLACQNR